MDLLAAELETAADLLTGVRNTLEIIEQRSGQIDRETTVRLVGILQRADKPLRGLADELRSLSLALTPAASEHEQ